MAAVALSNRESRRRCSSPRVADAAASGCRGAGRGRRVSKSCGRVSRLRTRTRRLSRESLRDLLPSRAPGEPLRGSGPGMSRADRADSAEPSVTSVSTERLSDRFDVVVIGAGQAGLAIGYFLARQRRRFAVLEAEGSVGAAWRSRWESLVLFTPRRYDALPGLAFPGDPDGYPTRDEVAVYLEQYAATFELPITFNSAVRATYEAGREIRRRTRRQADRGRPGCRCYGAVSGAERAGRRRRPRAGGLPNAQHRVSDAERPTGGARPRRRGW